MSLNNRQNPLSSLLQNILGGFGTQQQGSPTGPPFPDGGGPPPGPPPKFIPKQSPSTFQAGPGAGTFAVDPGALRPCMRKYVYIWLTGGYSFWAWLTFVGRNSVAGYRWTGRRWVYFGIDRRQIASFVCY